jgi:predicted CxxxxCH...CXXCH cytochrome family protein
MRRTGFLFGTLLLAVACAIDRATPATPNWNDDVAPILDAKCASCHSGASAAAGFHVDTYLDTIACASPSNAPVTIPANASAPILQALATPPHVGVLDDDETATLTAWITTNAPAFAPAVHTPDIIDPRSPNFHATLLRAAKWTPMLDPSDPNACGRCHDGTMSRPSDVAFAAPGAPSCTSCHDQPGGILACGTCHGTDAHAYPPRDPCFFPNDASGSAHAAHVESSSIRAGGFACSTCHPPIGTPVMGGLHGDGAVEVAFDASLVAPEMSWDAATQTCAVSCHDRGGTRPRPAWSDTPTAVTCNDCHTSPPQNHYAGACNLCHVEANADGTALSGGALHMNGKVDLGNGNGTCGACHGKGSDPFPTDGVHQAHENPTITKPIACASCHVVPSSVYDEGHLVQPTPVAFSGLAVARGAEPTWDGVSCRNVACHGANLSDPAATPTWSDTSGNESKCGACHGIPPTNHTTANDCNRSGCHSSETTSPPNLAITSSGLALHIDGVIEIQ